MTPTIMKKIILSIAGIVLPILAVAQTSGTEHIKGVMVPSSRRALFVDLSAYNRQPATAVSGGEESVPLESLLDFSQVKSKLFQEKTTFIQTPFKPDREDCLGIFHEGQADAGDAVVVKKYYMQSVEGAERLDYVVTLVSEKEYASWKPDFSFLDMPNFMGVVFFSYLDGELFLTRTYYYGRVLEGTILKADGKPAQGDNVMYVDLFQGQKPAGKFCITDKKDWDHKAQWALIKEVLNAGNDLPLLKKSQNGRPLVGEKYRDIRLPDPKGKNHRLSDYAGKGQWVLVDFWASWCGPCKRAMPDLVKTYKKYHDKGFEIVGLSFDAELSDWKEAIKTWDMPWIHLSDLRYWQSEAGKLYDIHAIPDNILIDPDGIIVARNLGGRELEHWLEEIYDK